ncbi:MAG: hypothetical protein IJ828_03840 [Treponema sp.]|nr:hypothetical protein [Treponema sp.]
MLRKRSVFLCLLLFFCMIFGPVENAYSETSSSKTDDVSAEPYTEEEFPQWSKDLRRAEIVSLGAIPFAAITVTMAYGGYQYATGKTSSFPNPLSRDNSYTKEEIFKIVGISAGIGLSIGIVDFAINYSKRKKAEKERLQEEALQRENIRTITPEEAGNLLHASTQNDDDSDSDDDVKEPSPSEDSSSDESIED